MSMYLGSNKISEINKIVPADKLSVNYYLNDELVGGGNLEGIKSIRLYAYYNQTNLKSITLPETLETMGSLAFYGCTSLKQVTCKAKTPPVINTYANNYFGENIEAIYIPVGTLEAYSTSARWSEYADKFVEKEGI